jgi:hypothetical protein
VAAILAAAIRILKMEGNPRAVMYEPFNHEKEEANIRKERVDSVSQEWQNFGGA